MWLSCVGLFMLHLGLTTALGNDNNKFFNPTTPGPDEKFDTNQLWSVGSVQEIRWTTTLDSYSMVLWQQALDLAGGTELNSIYSIDGGGAGEHSFSWTVQTYDSVLSDSPVYFFWVNKDDSDAFTSHYFNITNAPISSSSTSSSTLPTSVSNSSPQSAVHSTTSAGSANSSSSSIAAKVGLGVGLGVGIPLILIAGMWIGMKLVRDRRRSLHFHDSSMPEIQSFDAKYGPDPPPDFAESPYLLSEVSGSPVKPHPPPIYEASGSHTPIFELESLSL